LNYHRLLVPFNPLNYPSALMLPRVVSDASAWDGHIPFAFALVEILKPRTFVELGTYKGDSYCAFCQAVAALKLETRCSAIDTWAGDKHTGFYGPDLLAQLRAAHDSEYGKFSTLIQSTFDAAAETFPAQSIDLLHIDGLHTYDAVKHDFETWLPKLSSRAVVLFHDTAIRLADFGVWRFFEEISRNHPHFQFEHSAGLGVVAIGAEVPKPMLDFLAEAAANPAPIRTYFGRLGNAVEQLGYQKRLISWHIRQQLIINAWKQRLGRSIDPAATDFRAAFNDSLGFVSRLSAQVEAALTEDLAIRQQLQQPRPA
jgi:O-antigen biosynthesis protein